MQVNPAKKYDAITEITEELRLAKRSIEKNYWTREVNISVRGKDQKKTHFSKKDDFRGNLIRQTIKNFSWKKMTSVIHNFLYNFQVILARACNYTKKWHFASNCELWCEQIHINNTKYISIRAYLEPNHTSIIELFAKTFNGF